MYSREHLLKIRANFRKVITNLPDEDAVDTPELFEPWVVGKEYKQDGRLQYAMKLYKVLQDHTSQIDWTPDTAVSLYAEVAKPGTIPVWKQPTGAQDAYMEGDRVYFPDKNGNVYESNYDYNTWAPDTFGWHIVSQ